MTEREQIIECPCYPICANLGIQPGRWCRYRKSDLPPPGLHSFNPKDTWCLPGVQANLIMLAYMLAGEERESHKLTPALEQVRRWVQELRAPPISYRPEGERPHSPPSRS